MSNRSVLVFLTTLALAVGAVVLGGCGGGGDDTGGSTGGGGGEVSTDPISLPSELDGLKELVKAVEARGSDDKIVEDSAHALRDREGMKPDPSSELTTNCQRSGAGASVYTGASGYEGPSGLKSLASFTDAAWEAVAGE